MANISPLLSTPGYQATAAATNATKSADGSDPLGNRDAFLQLLVAQIKNQDPMKPADGVQFLTQLTQFSQLEQLMGIRQTLAGAAVGTSTGSNTTAGAISNT